jgi:hypothetical protein
MKTVTIPEPKDIKNLLVDVPPQFMDKKFEFLLDAVSSAESGGEHIPDNAFVLLKENKVLFTAKFRVCWCDEDEFSMYIDEQLTDIHLNNEGIKRFTLVEIRNKP